MAMISSFASCPEKHMHAWQTKAKNTTVSASKSKSVSIKAVSSGCRTCGGKGAIECPGCKVFILTLSFSFSRVKNRRIRIMAHLLALSFPNFCFYYFHSNKRTFFFFPFFFSKACQWKRFSICEHASLAESLTQIARLVD